MRPFRIALLSSLLAFALLGSCILCIPPSSADDEYGEYGATYDFNTQEIDDTIKYITGRTIEEWVNYLSDNTEQYTYSLDKADAISKFAMTRNTVLSGDEYTTYDRMTGYVKIQVDMQAEGHFPAPGTYDAKEGEGLWELLKRVFIDEGLTTPRETEAHMFFQIFLDIQCETHTDLSTGEITDSYIRLKAAMYEMEDRNIEISLDTDDDGNPVSLSVGYDHAVSNSNFFLDTGIGLRMEGMTVVKDTAEPWVITPMVTEHVDKFVISSDLANSVWLQFIEASDGGKSTKLPELILDLIGSGGRMLDLFDTIKSLTGSSVPDATVTGRFRAENITDARGYEYCKLTLLKDDGTDGVVIKLAKAAYSLDLRDVLPLIPDRIISQETKDKISTALGLLGWGDIDVKDISNDIGKKDECSMVMSYVNEKIVEDNQESYVVPEGYLIAAMAGTCVTALFVFLIWRRVI